MNKTINKYIFKDIIKNYLYRFIYEDVFIIFTIIWLTIIYYFSNQVSDVSASQSEAVFSVLGNNIVGSIIFSIIPIRKCAHIFLFAILGILTHLGIRFKINYPFLTTIVIGYICACADEIHQIFVSGRGALITDTFIDLFGVCLGLAICYIFTYISANIINKEKYRID